MPVIFHSKTINGKPGLTMTHVMRHMPEPEVRNFQNYILTLPEDYLKIYISLHSYGQYVLTPWGHTSDELPGNFGDILTVAKGFADAVYGRYQTSFNYGPTSLILCKFAISDYSFVPFNESFL